MGAALVIVGAFIVITIVVIAGNYVYCRPLVRVGYRPFPRLGREHVAPGAAEPSKTWEVSVLNGLPIFPLPVTSIRITADRIVENRPDLVLHIDRADVDAVFLVNWTLQGWYAVFVGASGRYRSVALHTGDMNGLASDLTSMGWPVSQAPASS